MVGYNPTTAFCYAKIISCAFIISGRVQKTINKLAALTLVCCHKNKNAELFESYINAIHDHIAEYCTIGSQYLKTVFKLLFRLPLPTEIYGQEN